jgi:nitroimidazol reductase NimA-like FMN-containing flavoprotein (pyridoxamine 5'-phosphate oxidase superfamily)
MAHPADSEQLTPFDSGDCFRVCCEQGYPEIGTEGFRKRANDSPALTGSGVDEGFICHVAFRDGDQPVCIPTLYARDGRSLILHGSKASRMMRALRDGAEANITVTHIDALVLARAAFHHSVNFRSVVVFGKAELVEDAGEKLAALEAVVEHAIPGRWADVRGPNEQEFHQTMVLRFSLDEASAKIRTGDPIDDEADYELPCWAGVIPLARGTQDAIDDQRLAAGITPPDYVTDYRRPGEVR